jgi:hypothetical protein
VENVLCDLLLAGVLQPVLEGTLSDIKKKGAQTRRFLERGAISHPRYQFTFFGNCQNPWNHPSSPTCR